MQLCVTETIYSGSRSDFGKVSVPVPVPDPDLDSDNIKHSFQINKLVQNLAFLM